MTPLQMYIDQIITSAINLGASQLHPKIVRYTDLDSLFYVSYGEPVPDAVSHLTTELVWICNDPDEARYKKAFRAHPFFPGVWSEIFSELELMRRQSSFYTEYVYAPVDSRHPDDISSPVYLRDLENDDDSYAENEAVPLSFIRELLGSDGGGGDPADPNLVRRVDVLEQEVSKLEKELETVDVTFSHDQAFSSTNWLVRHNFGEAPSVVAVSDSRGSPVLPEKVIFDSSNPNQSIVVFSSPETGKVACIR